MKHTQYRPYVRIGLTVFLAIAASILFFFAIFHVSTFLDLLVLIKEILRPIFMGLILAFLLLPVHRHIYNFMVEHLLKQKNANKKMYGVINGISIFLSLVFAFAIVYVLLDMVAPQVYISIVGLINSVPQYINNAQEWLMRFLDDNPSIQAAFMEYYDSGAKALQEWLSTTIIPNVESVDSILKWLKETIWPNLTGVVSNVSVLFFELFRLVKDLLIAIIVSIYALARKDTFAAQGKKLVYSIMPPAYGDMVVGETRNAYKILSGFINGKLLDSFIIGIITLIGCNLFHFPYPALIATIIGVTNIIPFFGPFIGAIPATFLVFMVSPIQSIYFILFVLVLQQFDGNILGPKVLGESTGLASFWVLFSILLFGGLFGFAGMVLGVPCFAILYSIVKRLVQRGLKRHGLPVDTKDYLGATGPMAIKEDQEKT